MRYLNLRNLLSNNSIIKRILLLKNSISYKVLCKIPLSSLNIYAISAYAFHIIAKNLQTILTASLKPIEKPIPAAYKEYYYIFSKAASDALPPYRPYNHKIELIAEGISIPKLEIVKAYLINNLNKGFIKASSAPYAALVLFVKKANSSLRFYINYYMLNNLTYKDRYLLPLIDKTLLNIRQAFYRIRIDPDSKELTTFRTRYSVYKLPAELNYAIYNKEMLAIIRLFGHFKAELIRAPYRIIIYTDYKALKYFITIKNLSS
ncbi:unnamed protein product [Diplocarpon coronariae]